MSNMKVKPLPQQLKELLANKSRILSQAQVFEDMGMRETAQPLWLAAASCEEQLAPLMENARHASEAALHRLSAASCYAKAGHLSQAVNLCRAALSGPLPASTQQEVETMVKQYLDELDQMNGSASTPAILSENPGQ
jgi:hypothetical protein